MTDPWTELEAIPAAMAAEVRPHLAAATIEGYQRYLEAMVHYTRGSGERLRHAADRSPTPALRAFFDGLAREEAAHHRLAEADLAAFGRVPAAGEPPEVGAFHRAWMSSDAPAVWLGALYVLENVAGHLARDAAENLGRLSLGPDRVRFVRVHLEADVEHGASTAEHARAHLGEPVVEAARRAAAFWVGLHVRALAAGG